MGATNNQIDKIDVNGDSRVSRKTAVINGKACGAVAMVGVRTHITSLIVVHRLPGRQA